MFAAGQQEVAEEVCCSPKVLPETQPAGVSVGICMNRACLPVVGSSWPHQRCCRCACSTQLVAHRCSNAKDRREIASSSEEEEEQLQCRTSTCSGYGSGYIVLSMSGNAALQVILRCSVLRFPGHLYRHEVWDLQCTAAPPTYRCAFLHHADAC